MNMKGHILAALGEQLARWEALLAGLSEAEITAPRYDLGWSIQDVVAHLWAWQQISLARVEAAAQGRAPVFPAWLEELPGDWEDDVDRTNAHIYAHCRAWPWPQVYADWRAGYRRLLEAAASIAERDLLSGGRYPWLGGYPLAIVLTATYDHHDEHWEWMREEREMGRGIGEG